MNARTSLSASITVFLCILVIQGFLQSKRAPTVQFVTYDWQEPVALHGQAVEYSYIKQSFEQQVRSALWTMGWRITNISHMDAASEE